MYFQRITLSFIAYFILNGIAFSQNFKKLDASPADILLLRNHKEAPLIKIIYGRPQKKGREIFGNLVKYNKVWRLGANEATEITFSRNVKFGGKEIKLGTYTMYAIPTASEWTIIINKKRDTWGHYSYQKNLDVIRTIVPVKNRETEIEAFSMTFKKQSKQDRKSKKPITSSILYMAWDKTQIEIPIEFQ